VEHTASSAQRRCFGRPPLRVCVCIHSVASDELIERFRPNLVIQTQEPFEEENWSKVQIGQETFIVCLLSILLLSYLLTYYY